MACFLFAALVVALDRLSKMWITRTLDLGAQQDLIPGVVGLAHVQNTGAAFGLLSNMRWLLVGISSVAVILLIVLITRLRSTLSRVSLAAVLGGAVGNLIDRILHGYVVDMFEPLFVNVFIFNVADCFVTIGGVLFCLSILFSRGQPVGSGSGVAQAPNKRISGGPVSSIFGGTVKDLSETKILEEYDIERLLREYNSDEKDD